MPLTIRVHERLNNAFNPKTVKIGGDVWMDENLAINDGGDGIYFNKKTNMYYYDWNAAKRIADSLPGWHLPSIGEWGVVGTYTTTGSPNSSTSTTLSSSSNTTS